MPGAANTCRTIDFACTTSFTVYARSLADRYGVLSRGEVIEAGQGADMEADGVRACLTV